MTQGYRTARGRSRRLDMNWLNFCMPRAGSNVDGRRVGRRSRRAPLSSVFCGPGAPHDTPGPRQTPQNHPTSTLGTPGPRLAPQNHPHRAEHPGATHHTPLSRSLPDRPGGRPTRRNSPCAVAPGPSSPPRGHGSRPGEAPRVTARRASHSRGTHTTPPHPQRGAGASSGCRGLSRGRDRGAAAGRCAWRSGRPGRGAGR